MSSIKKFICTFFFSTTYILAAPINIGLDLKDPPWEEIDQNGKPTGVNVDLTYAFGNYLGRDVNIKNFALDEMIPALLNREIDCIFTPLTATEARAKKIAFSDHYLIMGLALLISKKSKIETVDDLNQRSQRLVVKTGTAEEEWARHHLVKVTISALDTETECILQVVEGKADAFIYDPISICTAWLENQETTRADLSPFFEEPWAIGLRKEDTALKNQVDAFLKEFKKQGGFAKIADKYFKKEKEVFAERGIPFPLR